MDKTGLEPVKSVDEATASMTRPRNADDKTVITRRAFATGAVAAVGALFLEPVAGEWNLFWLPWAPEDAQADELNTVQVPADKILIAAKYFEKDSDGKVTSASGIGGVKVHVKSLYNGEEVEVATDEQGLAYIDLIPLACRSHSDAIGDFYEFDARVSLVAKGCTTQDHNISQYREVVLPRVHLSQGQALNLPMVPDDGKSFYFRSISFDDWDILYTNQEFITSCSNTATHVFKAEMYFPETDYYQLQPRVASSSDPSRIGNTFVAVTEGTGKSGCFKTYYWEGEFLNPDSNRFCRLQDGERICIRYNNIKDWREFNTSALGFTTHRSPCDDSGEPFEDSFSPISSDVEYGGSLQPGASAGKTTPSTTSPHGLRSIPNPTFSLPFDNMPKQLKGLSFSCWAPSLPVVFRYNPAGYLLFGVDLELFNYSNAPDVYTGDTSWRSQPRGSFMDQCERKEQSIKNRINQYKQMKADSLANGKKLMHKTTFSISFSASFQALAQMKYDEAKTKWLGDLSIMLGGGAAGSFTVVFNYMGFPFYVKFELSGNVSFGGIWGLESEVDATASALTKRSLNTVLSNMKFIPADASTVLSIQIAAALTLAAGIDGVAGAGVRGSGGISFSWQWRENAASNFPDKSDPRFVIGAHVEVALFAEIFGFKASWTPWEGKWPALYDSDTKSKSKSKTMGLPEADDCYSIEPECSIMQPGEEYYIEGCASGDSGDGLLSVGAGADSSASAGASADADFSRFVIVTSDELAAVAEIVATRDANEAVAAAVASGAEDDAQAAGSAPELLVANDFASDTSFLDGDSILTAVFDAPSASNAGLKTGAVALLAEEDDSYEYSWTEGHGSKYEDRGEGDDLIYKMGEHGVMPRRMDLIAKDVFSASRSKLIDINGARYLFRIAPVVYNGKASMRVVYQRVTDTEASQPYPVELQLNGIDGEREELYDYEFDVKVTRKDNGKPDVLLLIVSGERPNGDATTIYDAAETTIASAVRLEHRGVQTSFDEGDFALLGCVSWTCPVYSETGKYYMLRKPTIVPHSENTDQGFDRLAQDGCYHELGIILVKSADTKEGLLASDEGDYATAVAHFVLRDDEVDAMQVLNMGVPTGTLSFALSSLQPAVNDANALFLTMGFSTKNGCGVRSLKLSFEKNASECYSLKSVASVAVSDVDPSIKNFLPCDDLNRLTAIVVTDEEPTDESFGYFARAELPTVEEIEKHEKTSAVKGFAELGLSCVGPKRVPLGGLKVREGHKYFYYSTNHSGVKGYDYDDDGNATPHVDEPAYLIKAFAEVNGVFTDSFVFAQCDHPIDSLFALEDTAGNAKWKTSFVTRHVTSANDSKADLYAFNVPFLRSVSIDSVEPQPVEVMPGEPNRFAVTVTNRGNTVITQVRLQFLDIASGATITEVVLDFDKAENAVNDGLNEDTYYEEQMSGEDLKNILVVDDGDSVLIPGQTRSFNFDIEIPEDWSGTKELAVVADSEYMAYIDPDSGKEVLAGEGVSIYGNAETSLTSIEVPVASAYNAEITCSDLDGEVGLVDTDANNAVVVKKIKKFKVKGKKKSVKLSWAKHKSNTTGFEVKYAVSKKKLSSAKTIKIKKASAKSYTAKKLKSKKRYYFKMRAYKTSGSKTYRSAWTKVKSAKTK